MFGRHSEVHVHLAVPVGGIERAFHQMFLHGGAVAVLILMELQQAFGQGAVVQSGRLKQGCHHSLVVAFGHQGGNVLALGLLACGVEVLVESEVRDTVEELLLEVGGGDVIVRTQKLEQVLEHAAGGARGGHELHHRLIRLCVGLPRIQVLLLLVGVGSQDTVAHRGGGIKFQIGEALLEAGQLLGNLRLADAFPGQQVFVFLCHHDVVQCL